jgi:tripartite-type tricarboxylate transporter receptor subunit TctC
LPDTPFDPVKDFTPLSLSIYVPNVLVVAPSTGFLKLEDLLREARKRPGQLSYASPGNGSPGHLSFELLKQLAGIDVVHVPYRGAGPAVADLVVGHVPVGMVAVPGALPHIRGRTLIPLAVTSSKPIIALPNVPTVAQACYPEFKINAWHGILGPAGMPAELAQRIERDVTTVLKSPDVEKKLIDLGFEPAAGTGAELSAIIGRDLQVWHQLVLTSGARAN